MHVLVRRFSVIAGFSVLILMLIAGAVLTSRQLRIQVNNQVWVAHTRQVLLELETTESLLKDAETGQRGLLLTRDSRYLEPYNLAKSQVDSHLDNLERLIPDNPAQVASVKELRPLVAAKMAELQSTVDLYQSGDAAGAQAVVLSDRGRQLMNQIRAVLQRMVDEEHRLEAIREAQYESSIRLSTLFLYLSSALAVLGLCLLAMLILREGRLRERHAREIQEREERYRVTLTSIGDAVIATDRTGIVTFLNPVAENLTGRSAKEAFGRPIHEVFPIFNEFTGSPTENPVNRVMADGRVVGLANHTVLVHADGRRIPIEDSAAPICDDRGQLIGVVLVFRDATNERQAQEMLRRTEKLTAAARLSATVAHEINNPLEAISNLIYLSKLIPDTPSQVLEHLTTAEHELARVAHITRQTLGFYRESSDRAALDLREVMDSVLGLYTNKLKVKGITVERNYESCPQVIGVAGELRQALANLISNAMDAAPENGNIRLTIRAADGMETGSVQAIIEDDGPGIPAENRARIFEPFFTTKKDIGTGLGLYVTREIVERHGGTITGESRNGAGPGACFTVGLPCRVEKSSAEATLSTPDANA
jgi:PAS domain S-box-containing protein